MRAARLRVKRWKPKGSHLWVTVLHKPDALDRERAVRRYVDDALIAQARDGHEIVGFAFMVWDHRGTSVATAYNMDGHIPAILIPDFVRNRLLAGKIEQWTIDTLNGE